MTYAVSSVIMPHGLRISEWKVKEVLAYARTLFLNAIIGKENIWKQLDLMN